MPKEEKIVLKRILFPCCLLVQFAQDLTPHSQVLIKWEAKTQTINAKTGVSKNVSHCRSRQLKVGTQL